MQSDEFSGGPVDLFDDDDGPASSALPYADITDPQSLNKYAYTYNNPLRYVDPNGHDVWDTIRGALNATANDVFGAPRAEGGNSDFKAGQAIGDLATAGAGAYETVQNAVGSIAFDIGTGGVGTLTISAQVALVAVPAVVTARATTNLVTDVKQMSDTGGKPQGPVKAKDAPGVTAGNQATNEHGQKTAPSGKPQVNNVTKNTREKAKNAANKGSGVISDRGHFHTRRGTGAKKRDGVHYNYPD